ncbi:MAG: polyprenol monophosphomannose synthase [Chloroflexi bacterium]|nr:polyprenol monophosphomannose synthase [Chloroflexota bacterium]
MRAPRLRRPRARHRRGRAAHRGEAGTLSRRRGEDQVRASVILPTLNEAENIAPLIERIYAAVPDVHEVIVVDDASTDGTADIAQRVALAHPDRRIRVERRPADPGLTKSLAHGAEIARGDVLVWMDCDLSMPPEDIPRLLDGIARGHDIVVGSRFVEGGRDKGRTAGTRDSPASVLLSRLLNFALRAVLDPRVRDWTSGFIAIRRDIVLGLGLRGDYGEYFMDLIYRAMRAGHRVVEIPYVIVPRRHGVSKTATGLAGYLRRGRKYVRTARELRWASLRGTL